MVYWSSERGRETLMKKLLAALALGLALGHGLASPSTAELDESALSLCNEIGGYWTEQAQCDLPTLTAVPTEALPIDQSTGGGDWQVRYVPDWMFHYSPMNLTVN